MISNDFYSALPSQSIGAIFLISVFHWKQQQAWNNNYF